MERGALSSSTFPAFSKTVVPFLHITTKIEGRPYDDLLRKMGRGGFPTLLFLDAEGNKLASPRSRSVSSFAGSVAALTLIDATQAQAEAGDKAAAAQLLLFEVELGRVKSAEFDKRAAALEPAATQAHRTAFASARLDFRVTGLAERSYRGEKEAVGV